MKIFVDKQKGQIDSYYTINAKFSMRIDAGFGPFIDEDREKGITHVPPHPWPSEGPGNSGRAS